MHCELFIRDLVLNKEFELAETLINLLLENNNRNNDSQKNLYELIYWIISSQESKWKMSSEGIDYISKWIPLVKKQS